MKTVWTSIHPFTQFQLWKTPPADQVRQIGNLNVVLEDRGFLFCHRLTLHRIASRYVLPAFMKRLWEARLIGILMNTAHSLHSGLDLLKDMSKISKEETPSDGIHKTIPIQQVRVASGGTTKEISTMAEPTNLTTDIRKTDGGNLIILLSLIDHMAHTRKTQVILSTDAQ